MKMVSTMRTVTPMKTVSPMTSAAEERSAMSPRSIRQNSCALFLLLVVALATSGCSVRQLAVNKLADTLSGGGDSFASDDDPELIRDALPFALKTQEMLLAEAPEHEGLLVATCKGFTTYSFGFVDLEADYLELESYRAAQAQRERAFRLYERALGYCFRALELRWPGIETRLKSDPEAAVQGIGEVDDVEALYWAAIAWGAQISVGLDRPEVVVHLPAARALLERCLEIDEDWGDGTLHESMITVEALPEAMGGSEERARFHLERAVELSGDARVGPYVTWAGSISERKQDKEEFRSMLEKALAIDPEARPSDRLANLVFQKRARFLLDQIDDLFL